VNPIREIRQRMGMSQASFAKQMGVTRESVTRMEGRDKPMTPLVLAARWIEDEQIRAKRTAQRKAKKEAKA
jgi:DNA-binding XRE family transcriptional regulator